MADDVDEPTPIERGLLYRLKRAWEAGAFRDLPPLTKEELRLCNVSTAPPLPPAQEIIKNMVDRFWRTTCPPPR